MRTVDSQAFRQLAIAELDSVYRMAFHLARQPDQAADLVQETYVRAFQGESGFQLHSRGIKPWLFKILHNAYYSKLSKQRREQTLVQELGQQTRSQQDVDTSSSWLSESLLDWEHVDERLKHAIEQLPDHYREVLLLWAVEGLKYREIAEILGVALGTVMSRLSRSRSILNERLAGYAAEKGIQINQ